MAHQVDSVGLSGSAREFWARVQSGVAQETFLQNRQLVELPIDRVVITGAKVEIQYVIPTNPKGPE